MIRSLLLTILLGTLLVQPAQPVPVSGAVPAALSPNDWPQLGYNAQHTNASPVQVDGPYCYAWKWYEAPIASRAQPVVVAGRLFVGDMDGFVHARDATTGTRLWRYNAGSPIRHSVAVIGDLVITSTHAGTTMALDAASGSLRWRRTTGPSATAPLVDPATDRVYVASTNGILTAMQASNGTLLWTFDAGAPILTSPALSADGTTVLFGNEQIEALAVRADNGSQLWRTRLQGQSLGDRYPVVAGDTVFYRSQPLYFFHIMLKEGDQVLQQAGPLQPGIAADWAVVQPGIMQYLNANPSKQTLFTLDIANGASRGVAPVLYTYGNNDVPTPPVIQGADAYLMYRARRGIQNDGGAVHVTTAYDAELGRLNPTTLAIAGLQQAGYPRYNTEFRLTSDEPAMLTMSGSLLLVDNWERLGGINTATGNLFHIGNVSNVWPECYAGSVCGPDGQNPFFPLSGRSSDRAYPFPSPRVTEGNQRGGAVVANGMIYWRVIEGGIAGVAPRVGTSCAAPRVHNDPEVGPGVYVPYAPTNTNRALTEYITMDLTTPAANPPTELVDRLRTEVRAIIGTNGHMLPFYLERGFSDTVVWPPTVPLDKTGPAEVGYDSHGTVFWHDPGELLYTIAMAYPYLDSDLKAQARAYMATQFERYPPLRDLPYTRSWLVEGNAREDYTVPFRQQLNNWPPVAAPLNSIYAVWLWSKNTGDWSYLRTHWNEATALFKARRSQIRYYADIAGLIGYARTAKYLGDTAAYTAGVEATNQAMQQGRDFGPFLTRANQDYPDPRQLTTGWSLPVFYGMTPEIGLYLREQTRGAASNQVINRQQGDGMRWWYITRVGVHAEDGETSYLAPTTGWSHFLARAYILGEDQSRLQRYLDRPWGTGDLYSIQRLVATIQAPQVAADPDMIPQAFMPVAWR